MLDIEVSIHIHDRIIAHFFLLLYTKLSQGRVEDRSIILGKEAHIYTELHIQSLHPSVVVI